MRLRERELAGRIVLIGSGAPEVGGLRETPAPPLLLRCRSKPTRWRPLLEMHAAASVLGFKSGVFGAVALCLVAIALAIFRRPVAATTSQAYCA